MSEHPEQIDSLKQQYPHRYKDPQISRSAWIAPGAHVYGDVVLADQVNIWFNAVLRGDVNYIRIGENTNIQDLTMVHVSHKRAPAIIGKNVTVGHSAILHACTIGNHVMIGMGSTILDEAEIGDYVVLGAGSLVTEGKKIPPGTKAFGRPAKVVGDISEEERKWIDWSAKHYIRLAQTYKE